MQKAAFSILILIAITFVGCSSETISRAVAPSAETISADEIKQLLDSGVEFVFVDVREKQEIEELGTLANYVHIPIGELDQRIGEVPKGKLLIAGCNRGGRAGRAAVALAEAGHKQVKSAGLAEYKAKGYPLVYPKLGD